MAGPLRILVRRDEQNYGPYTVEQLNSLLVAGRLAEDDLAWIEGEPEWQKVATIPGVQPVPPLPPGAPPRARSRVSARSATESDRLILPAFLLAFFLGPLGVHRFYCGRTGSGIVMLALTVTVVGIFVTAIWATIDWILIVCGAFRDDQGREITRWT